MKNLASAALAAVGFAWTTAFAAISPTGDATNVTEQIQAAIDAAPNGTVTLAPGTYPINKTIVISNGASLIGGGSDRSAVVLSLETTATDLDMQSVLNISGSSDTVVSNLTVTGKNAVNGNTAYGPDVAIKMNSGLLVDCTIEDNKTKNGYRQGGGIKMTGNGTVRNCTIARCQAYNTSGNAGPGEGIWMSAGLVENCRIVDNRITYDCLDSNPGGAVYIEGTGILRGCLVAGNSNHGRASGVYVKGNGVVENCTIVGNSDYDASAGTYGLAIDGASVVVRNNIVWGNTAFDGSVVNVRFVSAGSCTFEYNDTKPLISAGQGNVSVDPEFVDAANGDYHPGFSFCSDAGINQDWMDGAVDLDGNQRIRNSTVDMGCYEGETPSGFACRMNLVSDGNPDLATVSLECGCIGGTATTVDWIFTRQEDREQVRASGMTATIQLGPGTWDVRLEVYGGTQSARLEKTDAVVVQTTRVYANVNGSGEFPYDTAAKGLPSINDALQVLGDGGTLYVVAGSYVITNGIKLVEGRGTRIEALAGPEQTIVRVANASPFNSDNGEYGLLLDCDTAYVNGLTLVAGRRNGPYYEGTEYTSRGLLKVKAAGAVVTNCVFRDLKSRDRVWGNGLDITAGTVVDCRFACIDSFSSGNSPQAGGVICLQGGLVDRVRVEACTSRTSGAGTGGKGDIIGVWGSGIFRNSLVTGCTCEHDTPVYVGKSPNGFNGGYIENCTIVANTNLQTRTDESFWHAAGVIVNGGSVTNCIVVDNWSACGNAVSNIYNEAGADGIGYTLVDDRVGDATFVTAENCNIAVSQGVNLFRKPEKGDYTLVTGSPAVNVGKKFDWMESSLDLAGNLRVYSRFPDLGCYEAKPQRFYVRIR